MDGNEGAVGSKKRTRAAGPSLVEMWSIDDDPTVDPTLIQFHLGMATQIAQQLANHLSLDGIAPDRYRDDFARLGEHLESIFACLRLGESWNEWLAFHLDAALRTDPRSPVAVS